MKKTTLLLTSVSLLFACNNGPKQGQAQGPDSTSTTRTEKTAPSAETQDTAIFDIESIPFTTSDIGDFPFFTLPKGVKEMNRPLLKNFDVCFFPIDGVMTPFEGKLYKININAVQGEQFSQRYFEKSMEDYLTSIGGVKVFEGEITREEYDRYNKQDPNKGDEGDIGYSGQNIRVYVVRSKDKGNIYVQYTADNASGKLNVLQEEVFQQTIAKVTADEIARDLNEKGKSILYINFDTDKSDLTADGIEVVLQIASALKKEGGLKINIEGHTDNAGAAAHNKNLSEQRATAVLRALTADGIEHSRLVAKGFGADRPLVANDSEENKARNRRVELVKVN